MYNWSVDTATLKKNKEEFVKWKLEQMINFGLGNSVLKAKELKKYFKKLSIDHFRRKFLQLLLDEQ